MKASNFAHIFRCRPFAEFLDLPLVNLDTMLSHHKTKKYKLRSCELTLFEVQVQLVGLKDRQNFLQVNKV